MMVSARGWLELSVTITNVKNQPPQWEKDSYSVVIPENTVRDTPIVVWDVTTGTTGNRHLENECISNIRDHGHIKFRYRKTPQPHHSHFFITFFL